MRVIYDYRQTYLSNEMAVTDISSLKLFLENYTQVPLVLKTAEETYSTTATIKSQLFYAKMQFADNTTEFSDGTTKTISSRIFELTSKFFNCCDCSWNFGYCINYQSQSFVFTQ